MAAVVSASECVQHAKTCAIRREREDCPVAIGSTDECGSVKYSIARLRQRAQQIDPICIGVETIQDGIIASAAVHFENHGAGSSVKHTVIALDETGGAGI